MIHSNEKMTLLFPAMWYYSALSVNKQTNTNMLTSTHDINDIGLCELVNGINLDLLPRLDKAIEALQEVVSPVSRSKVVSEETVKASSIENFPEGSSPIAEKLIRIQEEIRHLTAKVEVTTSLLAI